MSLRYPRTGIIPVIKYKNRLAVILFQGTYHSLYSDGGGCKNKDETDPRVIFVVKYIFKFRNIYCD